MEMCRLSTCDCVGTTWGQRSAGATGLRGVQRGFGGGRRKDGDGAEENELSHQELRHPVVLMTQLQAAATPGAQLSQTAAP